MIPSDVASRLQVLADTALRPVANIQEITDRLGGLLPGQRLMAEIQALMPNGTYRALINQRDVTLALPFSAKPGDALELEVVSTEGKLTLAVVARPPGETGKPPTESVSTTLSRTGQFIGNLLGNAGEAESAPAPTALNGNRPIASTPPATAHDILPQLKQAIAQSGLFYESHQAEWVEGRLPRSALLLEPQGRLAPRFAPTAFQLPAFTTGAATPVTGAPQITGALPLAGTTPASGELLASAPTAQTESAPVANQPAQAAPAEEAAATPPMARSETVEAARRAPEPIQSSGTGPSGATDRTNTAAGQPAQIVAAPALPLVQQQLEALATQNFVWQGQIWPGQTMRWEIEEDARQRGSGNEDETPRWQTSLRLTLPRLGEIDAQIRLQGQRITLALAAGDSATQRLLQSGTEALRSQLNDAGLVLASVGVGPIRDKQSDGAPDA